MTKIVAGQQDQSKPKQSALFMLAGISIQQKEFQQASALLERLLSINPDYVDAKVMQAALLLNEEKDAQAEALLNNILWEKPDSDSALVLLAKIYQQRGDRDKAYNKYLDAFKINPANKQALQPLVEQALRKEHNDYAKELIQTSMRRGGQSLDLLQMLAKVQIDDKDWEGAEKVIKAIETRKSGGLLAQLLSAQMRTRQEQFVKAIDIYQQILTQYPWHAPSLAAMANNYERLNKRSVMLNYLDEFIEKYPNQSSAQILKSRLLALDGKTEQAIALLQDYLRDHDMVSAAYGELAGLYLKQGKNESALRSYRQGLQKKPDNIKLLMALASFHEQQGQYDSAISQYEKVLTLAPDIEVVQNNLAAILLKQGTEAGIARAVELTAKFRQSEQPYFLDSYAWAQFKSDNVNEALTALRKVLVLAPDVPVFRYHLAKIYHQRGDRSKAVMELRQALRLGKKSPFVERESAEGLLDELLTAKR
nr:tetratricopeptide repeat protein [Methylomarinum sp. Ch1-1]MDP4521270.1 tetratricopeptide repeat protein [Methylomarinum sp. Ch1-1]